MYICLVPGEMGWSKPKLFSNGGNPGTDSETQVFPSVLACK